MPRLHTSCAQDSSLTHARPTRTHTDTGAHTAGGTHVLLHPSHSFSSFDSRHPSAGMLDAKLGHSPDGVRHRSVFVSAPAGLQVALGARQAELRDCKRGVMCRRPGPQARPWHAPVAQHTRDPPMSSLGVPQYHQKSRVWVAGQASHKTPPRNAPKQTSPFPHLLPLPALVRPGACSHKEGLRAVAVLAAYISQGICVWKLKRPAV